MTLEGPRNAHLEFPSFDLLFPDLDRFILGLVEDHRAGAIVSWDDLEVKVQAYFTPERMEQVDALVPHWSKMASYIDGVTLVHVMCVFMGLYMLPEFLAMSERQQQMMKWIILLHDVEKEPQHAKRDHPHAFRSAVAAARLLPGLGFATVKGQDRLLEEWSAYTLSAVTIHPETSDRIQDNSKLPFILEGIERMFGQDSPAALIIETILFHLAVYLDFWPPPAPLTDEEMKRYFDKELLPLLLVMHLADGEGWQMFSGEERQQVRDDTLRIFERVERLITEAFQT